MLNFRLKVFWAVAKHLSFRRAAEEVYLSQPAVSLQIKALEEEVGLQLFDRSGSHISLTAAGGSRGEEALHGYKGLSRLIYPTLSNSPEHKRIFKKQRAYPDLACPGGGIFDFTQSQ
jgi:DNA-binding transcriptional LysR family regulator